MLTGEVVATADGEQPFKVVFREGEDILAEWPVENREVGERRLASGLAAVASRAQATSKTDALKEQET